MKKYFKHIENIEITIQIEDFIYNKKREIFESIFRSYTISDERILESDKKYSYYICEKKKLLMEGNSYYTICDTNSDNWIFLLMSELEVFYAKILNCTVIHGSCVRINNKNILLIGERWSGKTTLTHFLTVENDGEYLTDDCIYIVNNNYVGFGMPLPMRTINNVNDKYILAHSNDADQMPRTLFSPPKIIDSVSNIDMVVFPNFDANTVNKIEKMSKAEAFNNIIQNVRSHNQIKTMFTDIINLATKAETYRIEYSSSISAYGLLFEKYNII